jgi:hypothetical protein
MSRILAACATALTFFSAGGCAHAPAVSSDTLPLK